MRELVPSRVTVRRGRPVLTSEPGVRPWQPRSPGSSHTAGRPDTRPAATTSGHTAHPPVARPSPLTREQLRVKLADAHVPAPNPKGVCAKGPDRRAAVPHGPAPRLGVPLSRRAPTGPRTFRTPQ